MPKTHPLYFAIMLLAVIGFAGPSQANPTITPAQQAKPSPEVLAGLASIDDGSTSFGSPDADVTIYEFSDYNCGFCKRAFGEVLAAISEDGNARLVVIEYPILADSSVHAARLALHAAANGKFQQTHKALMEWRGGVTDELLASLAKQHRLDGFLLRDLEDFTIPRLRANHLIAQALGIRGTPAFVIGGELIVGARNKDAFLQLIAQAREAP